MLEHTKNLPQKSILTDFDLFLLKQKENDEAVFRFYIHAGFDLKKFESKFT